jgi:hypothetical protein
VAPACRSAEPTDGADVAGWRSTGAFLIAIEGPASETGPADPSGAHGAHGALAALPDAAGFSVEPLFVRELPVGAPGPSGSAGGIEAAAAAADAPRARTWLSVRPPGRFAVAAAAEGVVHPWELAHRLVAGSGARRGPLAALAEGSGGLRLVAIEPDVARPDPDLVEAQERRRQDRERCRSTTAGREATICSEPSRHWPAPADPFWHLGEGHSQLAAARRRVAEARAAAVGAGAAEPPRVRIVHLDTGYDDDHVALPEGLLREASLDFADGGATPRPGAVDPSDDCFACNPGHGTGTLSILAGSAMRVRDARGAVVWDDALGGAPLAEVRAYRISPSVVHLTTGRMVRGFERAVEDGADVLSMSMGGLPSLALGDAVDRAYERGVAMFTAAGDFLQPPLLPVRSPRSVVYPARFARVVAVTGATADRRTYARAPSPFSWLRGGVASWALRGSYGPPSAMTHALAAYTPNVPWAVLTDGVPSNLLDLDGAGTSASTPQVAAAAALWLDAHRAELGDDWGGWRKSEAVYRALLDRADRLGGAGGSNDERRRYVERYFGAGLLRAADALTPAAPGAPPLAPRAPSTVGMGWLELVTSVGPFAGDGVATARLRAQLVRTEAAQLVAASTRLQAILGEHDLESPLPPRVRRRLLAALARDPAASPTLRAALAAAR